VVVNGSLRLIALSGGGRAPRRRRRRLLHSRCPQVARARPGSVALRRRDVFVRLVGAVPALPVRTHKR